jgi:hypothetical protein
MENGKKIVRLLLLGTVFFVVLLESQFSPLMAQTGMDVVVTLPRDRLLCPCAVGAGIPPGGIKQNYILREVPGAIGTLLLFTGANGRLNLGVNEQSSESSKFGINNSTNFLVRSRHLFASFGFNVAVMDAATDFLACPNVLVGFRRSVEHLSDIEAVMGDIRSRFPHLPVWVVGTSAGSISAAQAATIPAAAPEGTPDGLVLTSSVTRLAAETVLDVNLESIRAPTLIVYHQQDGCDSTPPEDGKLIASRLTVPRKKVKSITLSGGFTPLSGACDALSYHGYFGIEPKAADKIVNWIADQIAP